MVFPASHPRRRLTQLRRRGVAMVLAMLFMVLFAVMSIGFYASVTTGVRVTGNERYRSDAFLAAESGIQFLLYQLKQVTLSQSSDSGVLYDGIVTSLTTRLTATGNMLDADDLVSSRGPTRLPAVVGTYNANAAITLADGSWVLATSYVPGHTVTGTTIVPHFMRLGSNMGQATIMLRLLSRPDPTDPTNVSKRTKVITAAVIGRTGTAANPIYRALQYDLSTNSANAQWNAPVGTILTYSPVSFTGGGVNIKANITAIPSSSSTVPLTMGGGGNAITGTFSYPTANPAPTGVGSNGNTVATTIKLSSSPPPPTVDVSVFEQFVPSATATGAKVISTTPAANAVLTNVRIKANSNLTIGNNATLNGVIYVEAPNKLTIGGGSKVNGVIVMQNSVAYNSSTKNNQIVLNNGVVFKGPSGATTTGMTADDIAKLTQLGTLTSGPMVLASEAFVNFSGGLSMQNSSAIVGAQIQFDNIGSPTAFSGVILQLGSVPFSASGGIGLNSAAGVTTFPGLYSGGTSFGYKRSTYDEVSPWNYGIVQP